MGYAITFSCLCLGVCVCVCFDQRINKMKRVMRISLNFLKAKLCKDKKKGQLFFILHCPIPPHILSDSNHLDSLEAIPSHDVCKQVKYFFLLTWNMPQRYPHIQFRAKICRLTFLPYKINIFLNFSLTRNVPWVLNMGGNCFSI